MCDNGWFLTSILQSRKTFVMDSCWESFQFLKLASISIHNISLSNNTIKHIVSVHYGQEITWDWFSCWHHRLTMRQFEVRHCFLPKNTWISNQILKCHAINFPFHSSSVKLPTFLPKTQKTRHKSTSKFMQLSQLKFECFPISRNYGISYNTPHVHNRPKKLLL
jgi:hypothetical protein